MEDVTANDMRNDGENVADNGKHDDDWKLGRTRVCDTAGYRGTVLFVGPVLTDETETTKKRKPIIYVGVEWDDVNRGKHNGSITCAQTGRMISYFRTTHPTSGSFVPIHKVQRGVRLTPALLYSKYVPIDSEECIAPNNILPNAYALTSKATSQKPIYFLGEQQIRPYQQIFDTLQTLSLRCYQIASIQVTEMMQWVQERTVTNDGSRNVITELDLAGNLLCDWQSLQDVMTIFPTLQRLSLAANRLCDMDPSFHSPQHWQLRHLNVNGTHISHINTVLEIGKRFPNLQELILANNHVLRSRSSYDYESTDAHGRTTSTTASALDVASQLAQVFPNLTYLDCSNCTLELHLGKQDDDDVLAHFSTNHDNSMILIWSKLPQLQSLSLDDNPQLSAFPYPYTGALSVPESVVYFPCLQHLQFANTKVAHWHDVITTWQQHVPSLRSLRFRQCPLVQSLSKANVRHRLIAECPRLAFINATTVTEPERREAARWVFRLGSQEHVQYEYWMAQYPELAAVQSSGRHSSPTSTLFPDAIDDASHQIPFMATQFSIIQVSIRSMAPASCTMAPWVRRLPTQLTVTKLKALCARHFGVDIERQRLLFRQDAASLPQEMDCNDHTLHYFGVPDGAEILLHEMDE
jgi:Leucine-rich repeat (LRR) protein